MQAGREEPGYPRLVVANPRLVVANPRRCAMTACLAVAVAGHLAMDAPAAKRPSLSVQVVSADQAALNETGRIRIRLRAPAGRITLGADAIA